MKPIVIKCFSDLEYHCKSQRQLDLYLAADKLLGVDFADLLNCDLPEDDRIDPDMISEHGGLRAVWIGRP